MESEFPCRIWWDEESRVAHNDGAAGWPCTLQYARLVTDSVTATAWVSTHRG